MILFKQRPLIVLSILLLTLSLAIRSLFFDSPTSDTLIILKWYNHLYDTGWAGLASENFSNYPPAYLYLLWMTTLFGDFFGAVAASKVFPTLFDVLSMYIIFLMARLFHEKDDRPYLYAALFFTLPTVMLNSSGWGQVDSFYTAFLLLCVYLLMREKPFWAMLAFSIAFSFKAQAIFLLPFLGILFLKGKIIWYHFFWIPIVYFILAIPIALLGRSWLSILTIYTDQVVQFSHLSFNAPNPYIFVSDEYYDVGIWIGLAIFAITMAAWGWVNWRAKHTLTPRTIAFLALSSVALVVFTLPLMHERYFYPVDVFSYAAVIFMPEIWFIPILYQISSILSYTVYLWGKSADLIIIGSMITTFSTLYIVKKQATFLRKPKQAN
jgi:Gpi18-like mannosyltransferase